MELWQRVKIEAWDVAAGRKSNTLIFGAGMRWILTSEYLTRDTVYLFHPVRQYRGEGDEVSPPLVAVDLLGTSYGASRKRRTGEKRKKKKERNDGNDESRRKHTCHFAD